MVCLAVRATHPETPLTLNQLFLSHDVIIFAKVTGFIPQLPHLGIATSRNSPDIFPQPLVALSVLLDTLLDLFLVKFLGTDPTAASLGNSLRRWHIAHVSLTTRGRREADIMGGFPLFQNLLNLSDSLRLEKVFLLQTMENL